MKYAALLVCCLVLASSGAKAVDWDYVGTSARNFFSTKATYKATEELVVVDDLSGCAGTSVTYTLPHDALFQVPRQDSVHISEDYWIVDVVWPPMLTGSDGIPAQGDLFKLCHKNNTPQNAKHRYRRVGGMTTGILVVPYKWRKKGNNFSGESTLGPYVGFQNSYFTLALTAGLTQVSVLSSGTNSVKSETGFTLGAGLIFNLTEDFDIAFVAGKDHVFGSAATDFKYQDETWFSFGIGYKFAK